LAHTERHRLSQPIIPGPFREFDLANHRREDVQEVCGILDGWTGKLTWEFLIEELLRRWRRGYTRQALDRHSRSKLAFIAAKSRLRSSPVNLKRQGPVELGLAREPVIWLRNDYDIGLLNGSLGTVASAGTELVVEGEDEGEKTLDPDRLEDMDIAYAITTHKAQGSQFPRVVIPVYRSKILDRPSFTRQRPAPSPKSCSLETAAPTSRLSGICPTRRDARRQSERI